MESRRGGKKKRPSGGSGGLSTGKRRVVSSEDDQHAVESTASGVLRVEAVEFVPRSIDYGLGGVSLSEYITSVRAWLSSVEAEL
jgi:hypothetical protein